MTSSHLFTFLGPCMSACPLWRCTRRSSYPYQARVPTVRSLPRPWNNDQEPPPWIPPLCLTHGGILWHSWTRLLHPLLTASCTSVEPHVSKPFYLFLPLHCCLSVFPICDRSGPSSMVFSDRSALPTQRVSLSLPQLLLYVSSVTLP